MNAHVPEEFPWSRSRARREGQDLHHLTAGSRCSVCRWSPRGRSSNTLFFFCSIAGCNGRMAPRRRNYAILLQVSVANRSEPRTAIPRPSRRTGTAERPRTHDPSGVSSFIRRCVDGHGRQNNTNKYDTYTRRSCTLIGTMRAHLRASSFHFALWCRS